MKRLAVLPLLFIFIFIVNATPVFADKPKVKGYYIDINGQKQNVLIQVPTKMFDKNKVDHMQRTHFTVFDKRGKEKELKAEEATEVGFTFDGEEYVFRLLPKIIQKVTHMGGDFYQVLIEGPCAVYLTVVYQSDYYPEYCLYKSEDQYYITTTGVTNLLMKPKGRVDTMKELFSDCQDLVDKLKTKEYSKGDDRWFKIARYYNESCQAAEKDEAKESD